MIQAFVPLIKETQGTIANIGSGAGNITIPWIGIFCPPPTPIFPLNSVLINFKRGLWFLKSRIPVPVRDAQARSRASRHQSPYCRRGQHQDEFLRTYQRGV